MSQGADPQLESLTVAELIDGLSAGSEHALQAVRRAAPALALLVEDLVAGWRAGGRLIYVGAGTSGRIGQLDAAECVPTFGVDPRRVVALLAGGPDALRQAVEGAEDDEDAGREAIDALAVGEHDHVVGISASGSTPYTCAALERAAERGARTAALVGVAGARLERAAGIPVRLEVGDELVAGSTRLAAGTAQKLACNSITTAAFVRLGRVRGREMVAVRPTNRKLRSRAVGILREHLRVDHGRAEALLAAAGDDLPCALVMGSADLDAGAARSILEEAGGDISRALTLAARGAA